MLSFSHGLDVLGAEIYRSAPSTDLNSLAIVIRVKNIADLVKSEGGSAGELFTKIAPSVIEKKVYDEMSKRMKGEFAGRKVDADVQVVVSDTAPKNAAPSILKNVALFFGGAAAMGGSYMLYRLVK